MPSAIYFDNNATTHLDPVVAERMHELNLEGISNPASQHSSGRRALHLLEEAKSQILECVGARHSGMDSAQVVLTSGGTEANNLAVLGMQAKRPGITIVGSTDHPSVVEAARYACSAKNQFRMLPVNRDGLCDLQVLESWLKSDPPISLVSIMLGNNETGVIQDLKSICDLCNLYDVPVHSDIVQAIGKIPFNMVDTGLSALTLTGHKIHGPVGVGALILKQGFQIDPMIVGGGQQLGLRAGTEMVVPTVGLAVALKQIIAALNCGEFDRIRSLRNQFEQDMLETTDIEIIAANAPRLPHTANLAFPGSDRQALHMALDLNGLACSTGSACSSGSSRPSGVLVAMDLPERTIQSSLRFSFSRFSTADEVTRATKIIRDAVAKCSIVT